MAKIQKNPNLKWAQDQIKNYIKVYPRYQVYARVLKEVLEKAAAKYAPLAIVQTRPKSLSGFADKMFRKRAQGRYTDAINRITDLCGGRVIVPTVTEIKSISEFIENHFEIDWENTVDVSQRLKPAEFGYRAVHYIVKFRRGVFPTKDIDVEIPDEVFDLKAEIQVKTILEHAWGVFAHDKAYKGAFKIPQKWERRIARLAAVLEGTDSSFAEIEDGLKRYAASYGAYMAEEKIRDEIKNLKIVLEYDPKNAELAARIGKLAITLGDWPTAVEILSKHIQSGYPPILRDLGVATCKLHRDNPSSKEYKKGQSYLKAAIAADPKDTDAIASLAGTYKGIDEDKARVLYCQAFEIDPSDPYPLGNYLECEVSRLHDISIVFALRTVIDSAIKRCRDQADVGMNLPWAFYDMGKFSLLLGRAYESLAFCAKAVHLSHAEWQITTSLQSLEKLGVVLDTLPGYEWAQKLLLVGLAVKFPKSKAGREAKQQLKKLPSGGHKRFAAPVVIMAGGCDVNAETQIQSYHQVTIEGFVGFHGTLISGGTTAGVSGLAGEIGSKYPDAVRTIGYIPRKLPAGVRKDDRYSEIRRTTGVVMSPLESLQYWIDIIASGVPLSKVKVMGINGGAISAIEYRTALSLGVQVAVLEGSGGEAARLVADADWASSKGLLCLPVDAMTIETFVGSTGSPLKAGVRKTIAQAIHENYRTTKVRSSHTGDPAMAPWDKLPDSLKESNLQQADDISNKLHQIGCTVHKVTDRPVSLMTFTRDEIEVMAEKEHARWNVERLRDGWRWGETKDVTNKVSPYIVSWAELPEDVKEWDRETVRKIPEFLAKVGLEVRRQT